MGKPHDTRCVCCRKKRRGRCMRCVDHTEPCRPNGDPERDEKIRDKMNVRTVAAVHEN